MPILPKTIPPIMPIPFYNNCVLACFFQTGVLRDYSRYGWQVTNVGDVRSKYSSKLGGQARFWDSDNTVVSVPYSAILNPLGDMTLYIRLMCGTNLGTVSMCPLSLNIISLYAAPYFLYIHSVKLFGIFVGNGSVHEYLWSLSILSSDVPANFVFRNRPIGDINSLSIFRDGKVEKLNIQVTQARARGGNPIELGRKGSGNFYKDFIQEVALWDIALPDAECLRISRDGLG